MSSLEHALSFLKPRKGDNTNLIRVHSKTEHHAIAYNIPTVQPQEIKFKDPHTTLSLDFPYYRQIEPREASTDEFDRDRPHQPLYETISVPNQRMMAWAKLAQARVLAKAEQEIASNIQPRQVHAPESIGYHAGAGTNYHTQQTNFEVQPETSREKRRYRPEFNDENDIEKEYRHRYGSNDMSQPPEKESGFPSSLPLRQYAAPSIYDGQADDYIPLHDHRKPRENLHQVVPNLANDTAPNAIATQNEQCSAHEVPQQLSSPSPLHPPLQGTLTPKTPKDAVRLTINPPLQETPAFDVKHYNFPNTIWAEGMLDLTAEKAAIRANYLDLTKKLIASDRIGSTFLGSMPTDLRLHTPLVWGEVAFTLTSEARVPDGRRVYLGEMTSPTALSIILYPWADGASWETARAFKALSAQPSAPSDLRLHQFLCGSHSLVREGSQPPRSDRQYAYVESGFTMLSLEAPIRPLSWFISKSAPRAVTESILSFFFDFYRALSHKQIVHHMLTADTIFVSLAAYEWNSGYPQNLVIPMLWDYAVDRSMLIPSKASVSSADSQSKIFFANSDGQPYEGFFADLVAMRGLIAAMGKEAAVTGQEPRGTGSALWDELDAKIALMAGGPGYGGKATPSFMALLHAACARSDVGAVRDFVENN